MATAFAVRASPGKGSFSVSLASENPLVLRVELESAPEKGAANRELVFRLEKMLLCPVRIIAEQKSRRKTLAADCSQDELIRRLRSTNLSRSDKWSTGTEGSSRSCGDSQAKA